MGNNNNNNNDKSIFKTQYLVPRDYSKHAHTHTHTHTPRGTCTHKHSDCTQQRLTSNVTKPLDIHIMISPVFSNNSGFVSTKLMR